VHATLVSVHDKPTVDSAHSYRVHSGHILYLFLLQAMEMHGTAQQANSQQEQEGGEGMGDGDEGPLAALAAEGLPLPAPGQFDAEVQAAQAAAAEMEEEARAHAGEEGWTEQPLPDQDPGHLPGLEESLQRRKMYPAGRILHLVPARLVFDADELAKLGA